MITPNPLILFLESLIGKRVKIYQAKSDVFFKQNRRDPHPELAPLEIIHPYCKWKEVYADWKYETYASEPVQSYEINESSRGTTAGIILENGCSYELYLFSDPLNIEIVE